MTTKEEIRLELSKLEEEIRELEDDYMMKRKKLFDKAFVLMHQLGLTHTTLEVKKDDNY